ncbi:hypothetical protein [Velocimicrobium porci]|uniref:Uncharacterized protein n=1 Tax=Velocimicrobium porci TaxID=2606634 RepID=A0A6L5XVX6_9FIRM|nr:hypothetical protein [Velocimicrobium porci]MSS62986.1 hypothetical protein [Velocimicrobium porci]
MQERYIPAITMLSAGAIVCIFCIIKKVDTLYALKLLLGMLVLFYIVGLIAKRIIRKINEEASRKVAEEKEEAMESDEEQQEDSDEETNAEDSQGMDE